MKKIKIIDKLIKNLDDATIEYTIKATDSNNLKEAKTKILLSEQQTFGFGDVKEKIDMINSGGSLKNEKLQKEHEGRILSSLFSELDAYYNKKYQKGV